MASHISDVQVTMQVLHCWKCGIMFTVPSAWIIEKADGGEDIFCPNGDEVGFKFDKTQKQQDIEKLEKENKELKQRLFKALHDAEQAEGRIKRQARKTTGDMQAGA